jgi:hypothetical protein
MSTVGDLDATISQIRTAIFQLQQTSQTTARTLRARVLDLVGELTPALGFDPAVRFSGLLDTFADRLTDDLLAVVREALSNIARHAHAHAAEIDLTAHDDRVTLVVRDDGVGLSDTTVAAAWPTCAAAPSTTAAASCSNLAPAAAPCSPGPRCWTADAHGPPVVDQASSETRRCASANCISSTSRTSPSTCSRTPAASVRMVRIA